MPNSAAPILEHPTQEAQVVEVDELRIDKAPGGVKRWIGGYLW